MRAIRDFGNPRKSTAGKRIEAATFEPSMYRKCARGVAALASCATLACGVGGESVFDPPRPPTIDSGAAEPDSASSAPGSSSDGGPIEGVAPCSAGATVIYLLDTSDVLHSFDPTRIPAASAMKTIGSLTCATSSGAWAGASSMAVDRNAVAWVTDRNGALFKVDTRDATCQAMNLQAQGGFTKVGMGFAGDVASGTETLYVADTTNPAITGGGLGLGTIDLSTLDLRPIANFGGSFAGFGAELTGTGDGRLFGFFPELRELAQIDPSDAHVSSSISLPAGTAVSGSGEFDFAISFWGGVFFIYTAWPGGIPGDTTDVREVDPVSGQTTVVMSQVGFDVVGAGSSTCITTHGDVRAILSAAADADAATDAPHQSDASVDDDGADP